MASKEVHKKQIGLAPLPKMEVLAGNGDAGVDCDKTVPMLRLIFRCLLTITHQRRYRTQVTIPLLPQQYVHGCGVAYIRIDGSTLGHDRQTAVLDFKHRDEIRVAIVGVTAGGVGLDFSAAQTVVFVELPTSSADLMQVSAGWVLP